MKLTTTTLITCTVAAAFIGSARAATIATVGVYDENTVNANTVDAVSATVNNTLTLSDVKTQMAAAFANNTGGVWNFDTSFGTLNSGGNIDLTYGTSQANTINFTITGGTSVIGQASSTAISGLNHLGQTGSADRVFTFAKPLSLVAVTVVNRGSATPTARLVATLQDNSTIVTTASAGNTDTLHVLTALPSNPIVSFTLDQVGGTFSRYDDLAFIVVPEPSAFALSGLGLLGLLSRRRRA